MASTTQILSQLRNLYSSLSTGKKISFLIFMVLGVSAFMGVVYFAKQPHYRLLYSELTADDLSAIVEKLKSSKIPYQIGQGGASVSVPESKYYEVKMELATSGLPQGGSTGFELFDRKTTGMTEFQQQINYRRAMQGELERTIAQLSAIDQCRVMLALPKETLFKEDKREATASVIIKLKNNAKLTDEEVEGITFLVAGSVDGLEAKNVNLIDSRGRVLSKKEREDVAGPVNPAMIEFQRKTESNMENRIVELLSRVVGPEKVAAKVTAALDFRQVTKVEERFDPDSQVARSEQTTSEKNDGTEQSSSAAPGIDANVPEGGPAGEGTKNSNTSEKKRETVNYEINKVVSQISEPVGEVKKLSVAVMVDGTYKEDKNADGKKVQTYVKRTTEEMTALTALVKSAIGFNEQRGDSLEVVNVQFGPSAETQEFVPSKWDGTMIRMIVNYVLYAILLGIVVLFGFRLLRFLTREPSYQEFGEITGLLPSGVNELEQRLLSGGVPAAPTRMIAAEAPQKSDKRKEEDERLKKLDDQRKALMDNASKDKKAVTLMVRKWLKEEG